MILLTIVLSVLVSFVVSVWVSVDWLSSQAYEVWWLQNDILKSRGQRPIPWPGFWLRCWRFVLGRSIIAIVLLTGCAAEVEQTPVVEEMPCTEEFINGFGPQGEVYGDCDKYYVMSQVEDAVLLLDIDAAEHVEGDQMIIGRNSAIPHLLIVATDELEFRHKWLHGEGGRQMFVFTGGTWELAQ